MALCVYSFFIQCHCQNFYDPSDDGKKKFNMAVVMKSNTYENSAPIFLVSDREFQLRGKCSSEAASLFKAKNYGRPKARKSSFLRVIELI